MNCWSYPEFGEVMDTYMQTHCSPESLLRGSHRACLSVPWFAVVPGPTKHLANRPRHMKVVPKGRF